MCDYSLQSVKTRDAEVGDKLVVKNFGTGTRGFAHESDPSCAVCVKPGTEIAFDGPISFMDNGFLGFKECEVAVRVATFRQIHTDKIAVHHDAIEIALDGETKTVLLTLLAEEQKAHILQLPAEPKNDEERKAQTRLEYSGV